MSQKRIGKLVRILYLKRQESVSASYLAQQLAVSVKTVRNDIGLLNELSEDYGITVVSKSGAGNGYSLIINDDKKLKSCLSDDTKEIAYSPEERVHLLILLMLKSKKAILVSELSEKLFISKEQTYKDLKKARVIAQEKTIEFVGKTNRGILANGTEFNKRVLIAETLHKYPSLQSHFYTINDKQMEITIKEYIRTQNILVAELVLQPLIQQIMVILQRVVDGFAIEMDDEKLELQLNYSEYIHAEGLSQLFQNKYSINLDKYEIGQISALLEGCGMSIVSGQQLEGFLREVDHLLQRIYETYTIDFRNDDTLRHNLAMHLYRLFLKMDYNTQFGYDLDISVTKKFPLSFELARFCAMHLIRDHKYLGLANEIILITFYFATAIDKLTSIPSNILIVVDAVGRGAIEYILNFFKQNFSSYIGKLKVQPSYRLSSLNLKNYDHVFYMNSFNTVEQYQPFSSKGMQRINLELRGMLLKEVDLKEVFKNEQLLYLHKKSIDEIKMIIIDKSNSDLNSLREKNGFFSIVDDLQIDISMSNDERTSLWIGITKNDIGKNQIYVLLKQGRNGVVTDRALYGSLFKLNRLNDQMLEENSVDGYEYLCSLLVK